MKKILFFASASIFLVSCAQGPRPHPKMISFTPASVIVDYTENDLHEATAMAQQYCSSMKKDAQYVRTQEDSKGFGAKERIGFFNCIVSAPHDHQSGSYGSSGQLPVINNYK